MAGDDERAEFNSTFLQQFLSYVTRTNTSISLNRESTYDWESKEWSVPINFLVAQMLKIGKLPVQIAAGVRYWVDSPDGGPEDWGARLQFTFLFHK